jgi:hypothetical protein
MPMSRRDADAASRREARPDVSSQGDEPETVILDRQWAREAPVHELSARGRSVQRRLQGAAGVSGPPRRPGAWKRFRFWLFRVARGR